MQIRTVRRGFAALAIAATLGLAGAYPAAAAEPGWFERGLSWLSGLWSADDVAAPRAEGLTSMRALEEVVDKGYGVDPNGSQGTVPPPPSEGE